MRHCDECNTKLVEADICPWCHEELYINDYQMPDFDPTPVCVAWVEKVRQQREQHKEKRRKKNVNA